MHDATSTSPLHRHTGSCPRPADVAVGLLLAVVFATLAVLASEHAYFAGDLWISHHLQRIDTPVFSRPVDLAEWLATWPQVGGLAGVAVAGACFVRRRPEVLLLLLALTGLAINSEIKMLVGRPRPASSLVRVVGHPSGMAFPSGHTTTATLVFGLIFFLAVECMPRGRPRLAVQAFCGYAIVFTGLARIYHGAHWASDVYGSLLLGILVLGAVISLYGGALAVRLRGEARRHGAAD
jgi:membrane-associated phospholipid phosphatase